MISISGLIGMGSGTAASNLDDSRTYQMVDNVTWIRGRHTLIFGADIRHVQDNATTNNTPYGQISFSGSETGNDGADFILGVPRQRHHPGGRAPHHGPPVARLLLFPGQLEGDSQSDVESRLALRSVVAAARRTRHLADPQLEHVASDYCAPA